MLLLSALINALVKLFSALFVPFPCAACPVYVRNNLSSHWQDVCVPLLVLETQSLRNLQITWFCVDPFSCLGQTFTVNWSRGSGIQTELCGLELECHGKMFPPLFLVSVALCLFISSLPQLSEQ